LPLCIRGNCLRFNRVCPYPVRRNPRGDPFLDSISLILSLLCGAGGGEVAGKFMRIKLGLLPRGLIGVVGGTGLAALAPMVPGLEGLFASPSEGAGFNIGSILGGVISGGVGGGLLTAILGKVMGK
jgi:hypothetical protein